MFEFLYVILSIGDILISVFHLENGDILFNLSFVADHWLPLELSK